MLLVNCVAAAAVPAAAVPAMNCCAASAAVADWRAADRAPRSNGAEALVATAGLALLAPAAYRATAAVVAPACHCCGSPAAAAVTVDSARSAVQLHDLPGFAGSCGAMCRRRAPG